MDIETRMELVTRAPTAEIITSDELRTLLETNDSPTHYIGYEISGYVHLGTGLVTVKKIKDLAEAGFKINILLADYHSWLNDKLGGDLERIRKVAHSYFKKALVSLGLPEDKVKFILASEIYDGEYWADVLRISRVSTINRILRCTTIMGRKESEANHASHIVYPIMQAADIFKLGADVAHGGMDQRKVHMFAREISEKLGRKKAVALHTQLLMGLQGPKKMGFEQNEVADTYISSKMSKSDPNSCVFIHDSEKDIAKKIGKAYCPEKVTENNPIIQLAEVILMHQPSFTIERPAKYGGSLEIASAGELKTIYIEGKLHPMDLKNGVAGALSEILKPSRDYFEKNKDSLELVTQE